jgi:CRP/FNR family transcriptional regulator, cyclic AMP receptor protein
MDELLQIIRQIEIFHGLNEAQLRHLAQITRREEYASGDTILEQDSAGDSMYIIAEGQVEVLKRDAEGEPQTALFLGEGQMFGELALLDQGLRTATIVADDDPTVVYVLMRDSVEALCSADTAIGYRLMRNIALDLAFKLRHQSLDE